MTEQNKLNKDAIRAAVISAILNDIVRFKFDIEGVDYNCEIKNPPIYLLQEVATLNVSSDELALFIIDNLLCEGINVFKRSDIVTVKKSTIGSIVHKTLLAIHDRIYEQSELKKKIGLIATEMDGFLMLSYKSRTPLKQVLHMSEIEIELWAGFLSRHGNKLGLG